MLWPNSRGFEGPAFSDPQHIRTSALMHRTTQLCGSDPPPDRRGPSGGGRGVGAGRRRRRRTQAPRFCFIPPSLLGTFLYACPLLVNKLHTPLTLATCGSFFCVGGVSFRLAVVPACVCVRECVCLCARLDVCVCVCSAWISRTIQLDMQAYEGGHSSQFKAQFPWDGTRQLPEACPRSNRAF